MAEAPPFSSSAGLAALQAYAAARLPRLSAMKAAKARDFASLLVKLHSAGLAAPKVPQAQCLEMLGQLRLRGEPAPAQARWVFPECGPLVSLALEGQLRQLNRLRPAPLEISDLCFDALQVSAGRHPFVREILSVLAEVGAIPTSTTLGSFSHNSKKLPARLRDQWLLEQEDLAVHATLLAICREKNRKPATLVLMDDWLLTHRVQLPPHDLVLAASAFTTWLNDVPKAPEHAEL